MQPSPLIDWQLLADDAETSAGVDPRRRQRLGMLLFSVLLSLVFARVVQLEYSQGDDFRRQAAQPLVRRQSLPGMRGRILARDGSVLAVDRQLVSLAVRYRQLEQPPNKSWLRAQVRLRLSRNERRDPRRLAEAEAQVLRERSAMHEQLARLCGISLAEFQARAARIQARVAEIARSVNERRGVGSGGISAAASGVESRLKHNSLDIEASWWKRLVSQPIEALWTEEQPASQPIVVAEELDAHVIAQGLPLEAVAEIESHPERYPGAEIVYEGRRAYPAGPLAAHVLGHLGPGAEASSADQELDDDYVGHPDDRVGRMGVELRYETLLRGRRGESIEVLQRDGELISQYQEREPAAGRDLVLTLDLALQRTAEALLDDACRRRQSLAGGNGPAAGGAVLVLDVHSGAILAAASAPRFDPNLFSAHLPAAAASEIEGLLEDPAHPLFDRTLKMALPPGSVFKPLVAVALLENGLDPKLPVPCQGYLQNPDAQRCAIYTRHGIGHGQVTLSSALARSCNVYFYKLAGEMGPRPLLEWARRFGFGQTSGIDLPGEAAGRRPELAGGASGRDAWRLADTQALAIGQSTLTATPLQVARLMAAIANDGWLVTPHVVKGLGLSHRAGDEAQSTVEDEISIAPPRLIEGMQPGTLAAVREGLEQVVADADGTAHSTVHLDDVAIAGKTGTAETGGGQADHAWFAGYAPVEAPRVAFVVVIEHAGDGGTAAGPVARRLVEQMRQLGYFKTRSGRPK